MIDILSTVKRAIGVPVDIDEYDEDYYEEENERDDYDYARGGAERRAERYEDKKRAYGNIPQQKVVAMPTELSDMKVVVLSPHAFDDARVVCDRLKAWAPVIIKLDKLDRAEAQRVIDFIMGACYTLDGHVQEIKDDVFLVAPSMINIEKDSDDIKSVKSSSFFSKFL